MKNVIPTRTGASPASIPVHPFNSLALPVSDLHAPVVLVERGVTQAFATKTLLAFSLILGVFGSLTGQTTYTWNQAAGGSWATATNWTPTRTTPAANDILVINNGGVQAITAVPTQTIGRLTISGNTDVTLSGSGGTQTLTIGNGTGTDLTIASGSSLTITTTLENVNLAANASADISGTYTNNTDFGLSAAGVSVTVSGTFINTGTSGQIPGANATKLSFAAGSTYEHARAAGTIPTATWAATSTCNITGLTNGDPSGDAQAFGNLIYNCPSMSGASRNLGGANLSVAGNFQVLNTGSSQLRMTASPLNVGGNCTLSDDFRIANGGNTRILSVAGNVTINGGTIEMTQGGTGAGNGTIQIGGNLSHTAGTLIDNSGGAGVGTLEFNGTGAQSYTSGGTITNTVNLVVNKLTGALTLLNNATVNSLSTLSLTNGIINTGVNTLIVSNSATAAISGGSATSYVNGNLRRAILAGANTYPYPIGSATAYAPVSLAFTAGTLAGTLTGSTTDGDHANIGSSTINAASSVNRNWNFTINSGLTTANYGATFNWVPGDADGSFAFASAICGKYTGSTWTYPAMGTLTATSAQITGESGFSGFQIGNPCDAITAAISGDATICAGSSTDLAVTIAGGTGPYTVVYTDGSNDFTVTGYTSGAAIPVSPTATTTYNLVSVSDAGDCAASVSGSAVVTVNQNPACTISGLNPVCANTTNAYDGPVGMSSYAWSIEGNGTINGLANMQSVTIDAGMAGTYTVTLTVSDGTCTSTCSTTVTVNANPVCSILGTNAVCANAPGRTFNAPAGMASYAWSISGSGTIVGLNNAQMVTVDAGASGDFTLTLMVTDANDCVSSCQKTVSIISPVGPFALSVIPPDPTVSCMETVDFAVEVDGFCDLTSLSFAVLWDPAQFSYDSYSAGNTAGGVLVVGDGNTGDGELTYTWNSNFPCPSLPDGTTLITISLKPLGCHTSATVAIGSTPAVAIEAYDCDINLMVPNITNASVEIEDNTPPNLSDPGTGCSSLELVNQDLCNGLFDPVSLAAQVKALYQDNCDNDLSVTVTGTTGGPVNNDCSWTYTYEFTIEDDCTNSTSCEVTVSGGDDSPPTWTTAAGSLDVTVECGNVQALANAQAMFPVATDLCDQNVTNIVKVSGSFMANGDCPPISGTITNTWTVTDACGNTSTVFTQVIVIADTQAPTWVTQPGALDRTVQCSDNAGLAAAQSLAPTAIDNCDLQLSPTKNSGTFSPGANCPQAGTITNTWVVADDCGNVSTVYTQVITIVDTQAPTWTTQPGALNATVECDDAQALADAQALFPVAIDNCDNNVTDISKNEGMFVPGNDCPQEGTITNTWTVTDDCGNTSTVYTQVIIIVDTQAPTWTTPAGDLDRTVECNDAQGLADAQALLPEAADNCDGDVTDISKNEGAFVPGNDCPQEGTITNTWTVTDDCNNTSTVYTQVITIVDTEAPTLTGNLPGGTVGNFCIADAPDAPLEADIAAAYSDNCGAVIVTLIDTDTNGDDCSWTVTFTYTVEDECGNFASNAVITYSGGDIEPPALTGTLPGGNTGNICLVDAPAAPAEVDIAAQYTDNCGAVTATRINTDITGDDCNWTAIYTYTVEDECGNFASNAVVTYTGGDTEPPALTGTLPGGAVGNVCLINAPAAPAVSAIAAEYSDNCGAVTATLIDTEINGDDCSWTVTYTYSIQDECDNFAADAVVTYTGGDDEAPVLTGTLPGGDLGNECLTDVSPAPEETVIAALYTDNCGDVTATLIDTETTGDDCDWTVTYIYSIQDECGNFADNAEVTFSGSDDGAPAFTTPANLPANAGIQCGAENDLNSTGFPTNLTDNCLADEATAESGYTPGATSWMTPKGYMISISDVIIEPHPNGDCSLTGNGLFRRKYRIERTFTVKDACGNSTTGLQLINIVDNMPPVLSGCPQNETVECDAIPAPPAIGTDITATDNCDDPSEILIEFDEDTTPGNCPDAASITRTWTATDKCGYATSCVQVITVVDTTDPTWDDPMPANETVECDEVPMAETFTASDNCDTDVEVGFEEIRTNGDCPNRYTLTRTWTATDNCGNVIEHVQTIIVIDITPPVITFCPPAVTVECDESLDPGINENLGIATATDNCAPPPVVTYSDNPTTGNCPQESVIFRTWLATDACGNTTACGQSITVDDSTPPVIDCPGNLTVSCTASTNPDATGAASATDNCTPTSEIGIGYNDGAPTPGACPQSFTINRTWLAVDACGNQTTCLQTIFVQDITPPAITCPNAVTVECDQSLTPGAGTPTGTATATDNCDTNVGITHTDVPFAGTQCPQNYIIQRTWKAQDDCGNMSSCVQSITVRDTKAPVFTLEAADKTVECDGAGNTAALNDWLASNGGATATDNCGMVSWSNNFTALSDDCGATGSATVTFTATDQCGNSAQTTATFTIEDTTDPVIDTEAEDLTVECDGNGNTTALNDWLASNGGATASDDCGMVTWSNNFDELNDDCGATGSATVTFTATDDCGNTAQTTATFTIEDTTEPSIDTPASDLTVECDGNGNTSEIDDWLGNNGNAEASDACGGITWSNDYSGLNGACAATGSVVVTFTATDDCGNESVTTATLTIEDTTPPSIDTPAADETVECDGQGNILDLLFWIGNNGGATASDACGNVTWSNDFAGLSDDCGATGSVTVIFKATDDCGNATTTEATFTIEDTTLPTLLTPAADETVECDGQGNTAALNAWLTANGGAVASDICGGVTWSNDFAGLSDDCGATGSATVTFTATDDCGNETTTVATFKIVDTTKPAFASVPVNVTVECDAVPAPGSPTASDACDPMVDISLNTVSTKSTDNTACAFTNYTITHTWTATDDCGNSTQTQQVITVQDTKPPVLSGVPANTTAECDDVPAPATPTATDNCDPDPTIVFNETSTQGTNQNNCNYTNYTITRTWTVSDNCGNSTFAVQTITVSDNTPPEIVCPPNLSIHCEESLNPAVNTALGVALATDNCDPNVLVTYSDAKVVGQCPQDTVITRTWLAADNCQNAVACNQIITKRDVKAPDFTLCPDDITVECSPNQTFDPYVNTALGLPDAEDNCDPGPLSYDYSDATTPGACDQEFTITRTWSVKDACGNINSSCEQVITVTDNTPPLIDCPDDITVECDEPTTPANTGMPTTVDACDPTLATSFTDDVEPGACPQERTITRTWITSDGCGNAKACTQTIVVDDSTPPVWTTPVGDLDRTVECSDLAGLSNAQTLAPVADDNCDDDVTDIVKTSGNFVQGQCPQAGTYTNTWIVTDACGNTSTIYTQVITVQDMTNPTFTVPADVTIYSDADCEYDASVAETGDVTDEDDNCASNIEATFTDAVVDGQCAGDKVITRTWSLDDGCGNIVTKNQIITVSDTIRPVFPKPVDMTLETINGADCPSPASISLTVDQTNPVATGNAAFTFTVHGVTIDGPTDYSDNCSSDDDLALFVWNIIEDFDGPATACLRKIRVVWRVYDDCGNFRQRQQTFTIIENTPPELSVPNDVTVSCENPILPANTGTATATDNCDPAPVVTFSDATTPGNCPQESVITRSWTATDICGNSTVKTQTITVVDNTAPVLICPNNITINCEVDPVPANTGAATATDNCDQTVIPTHTDVVAPGNCPDRRTITRTWTVADDCGNSTLCVQIITVQDTTKPVIVCPMDVTVECDESLDPGLNTPTGIATATDNCDASPAISHLDTPIPGNCPQERVINRRWVAVDNCLNARACIQKITVVDDTPPTITCPLPATVECDEDTSPANTGMATATDNCASAPVITHSDVSSQTTNGSCSDFNYTITRTWTATDACGNSTNCVQTITVNDTTIPEIDCPATATVECDQSTAPGPNTPTGYPTVTDNCDPAPGITHTDDPPTIDPDCPQGKSFIRTWVALDACANVAVCEQLIIVVDNTAPVVVCPKDTVINCNTDTSPASLGSATATDNCGMASTPTHSDVTVVGQCPQDSIITRTWLSVDECGNEGSCIQIITVRDTVAPLLVCPKDTVINCETSAHPDFTGYATADDNCDPDPVVTHSDVSTQTSIGACSDYMYTITRTWLSEDACSNIRTCIQIIAVQDTTKPVIICPADTVINCTEPVTQPIGLGLPTTSDNCDPEPPFILVTQNGVSDPDCPQHIVFTLTYLTVDYCGNSATCQQIVTVQDTIKPEILCPQPVTIQCDESTDPAQNTALGTATATDACDPDLELTYSDATGMSDCPQEYSITRTWTATDACGNSNTCVQIIEVVDTEAPVFTLCPTNVTVECDANASGTATDPANTGKPEAEDNCDDEVSFDYSDVEITTGLQCPVVKSITRTWTAYDDCGNQNASCIQVIRVLDNTPPLIECPDDLTITCDVDPDTMLTGVAIAIDACDVKPTITWDDEGSTAPCKNDTLSVITRTWFAFDICGNVAVCDQFIAVIDEVEPEITCPKDTVINCEVPPIPENTGFPEVADNCDLQPVTDILSDNTVPDPDCPQGSKITRTWITTDHCGNSNTCIQIITVQDTTKPVIICPPNVTVECDESTDPANTGKALATDNCTPAANIVITKTDMTTSGNCPDSYTIKRTWLAGDGCDNGALCMQTITVRDTEGPVVTCPADTVVNCNTDTSPMALGIATADDNCGNATTPTFTDEEIAGNCPQEKTILRTWSSTDDCNNTGTCLQTITVQDTTKPTFTVPGDVTVYTDADCEYDASTAVTGDVTDEDDNCGINLDAKFEDIVENGQCEGDKIITRIWSLDDGCGNVLTQKQLITVSDTLKPIFPKPADMTLTTEDGATCPGTADISLVVDQANPVATGNAAFTYTVHGITIDGPTVYSDNCSTGNKLQLFVWNIFEDWDGPADECQRKIRVIWRVYDNCGNFQQRQQIFTILENTPPVITCPADQTVNCEESTEPLATGTGIATATDNCDPDPVISSSDEVIVGNCPQEKILTRTWTATDFCDNTATCVQTIAVVDDEAPVLSCPPNLSIHCEVPAIPANTGMATATDNCDADPDISFADVSTQTNNQTCTDQSYVITRTWTAVDECGNQASSCVQIITVRDIKPPVITCPPAVSVNCGASLNPSVNLTLGKATAVDNCDPEPGVTFTDVTLTGVPICPEVKVIIRTWLAIDNCNNPAACTQRIAVVDLTPPAISCPKDTVINCEADYAIAALGAATATDNCGTATVINPPVEITMPGTCPQAKIIKRTWTAIDNCANTAQCTQTIMVQDTTRPVIVCPQPATVQCGESIDPAVNPNVGKATATDNCDADLATSYIDTDLGGDDCTKTVLRNWITADDCNNAAACTQLITITDSEPPKVDCPDDATVECGEDTSPDALGYATAEDACGGTTTPTFTDDSTLGACPQEKTILRKWISEDDCGNVGSCVQTIVVDDSTPPAINCPADVTVDCGADLDPYQNENLGTASATDNCDADPVITYEDVTETGPCPTGVIIVRTWTATDACGNATSCVQRIALNDNEAPAIDCPADVTVDCGDDLDPYVNAELGIAVATDDCAGQTVLTYADVALGVPCPLVQIITRTWTVVDPCDNSTICVQIITVQDVTEPEIVCPDDLTLEWPAGFNIEPVQANQPQDPNVDPFNPLPGTNGTGVPEVSDNCTQPELSYQDKLVGPDPQNCPNLWVLERTWKATDGCGNMTTCIQTITFTDMTAPEILCPKDTVINCEVDPVPANTGMATATDNCGEPQITYDDVVEDGACPQEKKILRTWKAVDNCQNATICVQVITVQDTTKPVLVCPDDLTLEWPAGFNTQPVDPNVPQDPSVDPYNPLPGTNGTGVAEVEENCGQVTVRFTDVLFGPNPDNCPELWVLERTWTAEDECGNRTKCVQRITFTDTTPPEIACPQDLTLEWPAGFNIQPVGPNVPQDPRVNPFNAPTGAPGTGVPQVSDNCGIPTVTFQDVLLGPNPDDCPELWVLERTWTATDACGNTNTCVQRIVFTDTTPPTIACPQDLTLEWPAGFNTQPVDPNVPQDPSVDPFNPLPGTPGTGVPQTGDNCGTPNLSFKDELFGPEPDNCPELWVLERTWTAMDACGLTATCVQRIVFTDLTPPVVDCPQDLTLEWPAGFNTQQVPPNQPQDPSVHPDKTGFPQVSDNCGVPTVQFRDVLFGPEPDDCPELWVLERTWLATDACGNTNTCIQRIVFTDLTPPDISCPKDTVIDCTASTKPASTGTATATDNCGIPSIDYSDDVDPGACPQEAVIKRTWIAVDACGNEAICVQFITVQDTTPPTFTAPKDTVLYLDDKCEVTFGDLGDVTDEDDNCSTDLDATFTDNTVPGPGQTERTIFRTWKLTDDCGNMTIHTQTIAIRDTIPPMLECPGDAIVAPNTDTCSYVVTGKQFDPVMFKDNCGVDTVLYKLSGATAGSGGNSLAGVVFLVGNTVVTWTVIDVNGNTATCSFNVRVSICNAITGTIIWEGNDFDTVGVAQATVELSGDDTAATGPTPADGTYSITPATGSNFMITPKKPGALTTIPIDPMNGVTADDALAIRMHVYGFIPITDPYKLIAADVDMNNMVTLNDEVLIRRALLGSEPALEYFRVKPWRFVPDTTDTPWSLGYHPPANPFSSIIPEKRTLTGVTSGATKQNFYGIKVGDVNATANPLLKPASADPLIFRIQDEHLVAGKELTVYFRAENFDDLLYFQQALYADPAYLKLTGVEIAASPLDLNVDDNFGLSLAAEGEIRTLWMTASAQSVKDGTPVFALRFKALQGDRLLSEVLRLKPKALEPMARNADLASAALVLVFDEALTTAANEPLVDKQIELRQNTPNPFWYSTVIGFVLPEACKAQLRILDASGRELYRIDNDYPAGYNAETIYLRDIGATGILYYELTTPYGKQTRAMKAVRP